MIVDILVEGQTDEFVASKIIRYCGLEVGTAFGKQGVAGLRRQLPGFNQRARFANTPILALVDFMDTQLDCPPAVPATWLPGRTSQMLLRAIVRELESWLLADAESLGRYLKVSPALFPDQPESILNPKQDLVNLARRSRNRRVREAIAPREGYAASVGPGYLTAIHEYVETMWRVDVARTKSPSLDKCLRRLEELRQPPP